MTRFMAISLHQPWASLLFAPRAKVHETRSWAPPGKIIGHRILIHAAKKLESDLDPQLEALCERALGPGWARGGIPRGAFVGSAVLASSRQMIDFPPWCGAENEADFLAGDWTPGRFAWRLDRKVSLPEPIPAVGRQGFWGVDFPADGLAAYFSA